MQHTVEIKSGQCYLDIANQTSGDISKVFDLARKNGQSITDDLESGSILQKVDVASALVEQYYRVNKIFPASDDIAFQENEGIEFDSIESPEPYTHPY